MKGIRTSKFFTLCSIIFITSLLVSPHSVSEAKVSPVVSPAVVNGRILITNINSSKVSVLLQINTISGLDALGGATIVIGFDTSAIGFNATPIKDTDYVFHNFCGGNYSPATVTRPRGNRIWINIDLPYQNCNKGALVTGEDEWMDLVTINFDVLNEVGFVNIYWLYESPFWGIYDDDNITVWNLGLFEELFNIPLPVELSVFTARLSEDRVILSWTTETEVNNYGFDVERKVNDDKWNRLGFVTGNGNSNTMKTYSFVDNSFSGGNVFYYRLKQIDTDGSFEYSEIVEVETSPSSFSLSQNYPNPFNPFTAIRYLIPKSTVVILKVFDMLGNEVSTLVNEVKERGVYSVSFDASNLASGIYFYRLQAGNSSTSSGQGFVETKKMILLK